MAQKIFHERIKNCPVPGCTRPPVYISRYCEFHVVNVSRHGHWNAKVMQKGEKKAFEWVREVLLEYRRTSAVQAALEAADDLLHYRSQHGYKWERVFAERMAYLLDCKVTPLDALDAITRVAALIHHNPQRFPCARAEHHQYTRSLLLTASMHRWRPAGAVLYRPGALIASTFSPFWHGLFHKLDQVQAEKDAFKKRLSDFDTPRDLGVE